jgi:hypothetical protein
MSQGDIAVVPYFLRGADLVNECVQVARAKLEAAGLPEASASRLAQQLVAVHLNIHRIIREPTFAEASAGMRQVRGHHLLA